VTWRRWRQQAASAKRQQAAAVHVESLFLPVTSLLPAQEIHTLASDSDYLAFPAVIGAGDEVLVSFKRGKAHAALGSLRAGVLMAC
jgi:hypothetical protein